MRKLKFIKIIKEKPLLYILLLAFSIRFIYFIAALVSTSEGFYVHDSYGYWQIADNVRKYGVFSQSYELPINPDYYRTPLYPLFIILAESIQVETIPTIILQLILGVLTCYYTFKLSELITKNKFIASIAALLMAIDVPNIVMNNLVLTETLFTFLLIVCIYFFVKYLKTESLKSLLFVSIMTGLLMLCRPISFFIPFFLGVFMLYSARKKRATLNENIKQPFLKPHPPSTSSGQVFPLLKKGEGMLGNFIFSLKVKTIFHVLILFGITLVTISPWLIRNKSTFNHYFLSVIREHDMQNYQAATIYAELNNMSLFEAQGYLRNKTFMVFGNKAHEQPYEYARYIENDAMEIMFAHPKILFKHHATQFMHFFLKPCRAYIDIQMGHWGDGYDTIPKDYPIFKYLFEHNSKLTITIVFFQLFILLICYVTGIFGIVYFKQQKQLLYFFLLGGLVFCFANLTLPYVTESRFRAPVVPYISIIAACGIGLLREKFIQKRLMKKHIRNKNSSNHSG